MHPGWLDSIGVANEGEVTEGISRTYLKELMAAKLTGKAADLQKDILAHKEHVIKKDDLDVRRRRLGL